MAQSTLITDLVSENTGWTARLSTGIAVAGWMSIGIFVTALIMAFSWGGFRNGFLSQLSQNPLFLFEVLAGVALIALTSGIAVSLSVPGSLCSYRFPRIRLAGLCLVFLFSALLIRSLWYPTLPPSMQGKRAYCFLEALVYGALLLVVLQTLIHRRYSVTPRWSGFFAGVAACVVPGVLMHLGCMYDPAHILSHHFSQVLVVVPVKILVSYSMFSRKNL